MTTHSVIPAKAGIHFEVKINKIPAFAGSSMKLEICASNYQSAINAQEAGAHRIELCSELSVGGVTASYGLIKQVVDSLSIPVFVLIRPRSGDFVYSETEFEIMKQDILRSKNLGCSGIVSGVLQKDNTMDIERTKTLIELSRPLPFTFHRAFDEIHNPIETMEQLVTLGAKRILTSGQKTTAEEGFTFLKRLNEKANQGITILPGSGISPDNAKLFKDAGFSELHASATNGGEVSDFETIKSILNIISNEA